MKGHRLSEKARKVLTLLANGQGSMVIPCIEYAPDDVEKAAREALRLDESVVDYSERLAEIKEQYPNAYEKWTEKEEALLADLYNNGVPTKNIALQLQRQPSAIRSRLSRLGLDADDET